MFLQLAPSVDCDGSAVSLMSAASLWAALWAGTKRASIVMLLANHGKSTLQKIVLYAIRLSGL